MAKKNASSTALAEQVDFGKLAGDDATQAASMVERGRELALSETVTAMAEVLGYDGALSVGALEDGIRFYQRRTVEDCLELGKRLLLLKEIAPHGDFNQRLELLGFARTTAHRFMMASAKTSKCSNLEQLSSQVKNVSAFLELVTHDEDTLKELAELDGIDRMSASELRARVRELQAGDSEEVSTLKKREKNYEAELERSQLQIKRLSETKKRLTEFEPRTEEIRQECMALQLEAELPMNSLQKLFDEVLNDNALVPTPESQLRLEQVWVAAHIVASTALDMIANLYQGGLAEDMPKRALGTHILSREEAQNWLLSRPMIENRHEASKAQRKEAADAAKPRGRGRPSGSKNKAD